MRESVKHGKSERLDVHLFVSLRDKYLWYFYRHFLPSYSRYRYFHLIVRFSLILYYNLLFSYLLLFIIFLVAPFAGSSSNEFSEDNLTLIIVSFSNNLLFLYICIKILFFFLCRLQLFDSEEA